MEKKTCFLLKDNFISYNEDKMIDLSIFNQVILLNIFSAFNNTIFARMYENGIEIKEELLVLDKLSLADFVQNSKDLYPIVFMGFDRKSLVTIMNILNARYLEYHANCNEDKLLKMKKKVKRK